MGADWIEPILTYGFKVDFKYFPFDNIKCNHGEGGTKFSHGISMSIVDASDYVVQCWKIFRGRFLQKFLAGMKEAEKKEYLKAYSKVDCIFACTSVRGYYEKLHLPDDSYFVFGYREKQIEKFNITEIGEKLGDLPEDLSTHLAQFIYLFSETEVFWEICKDGTPGENKKDSESEESGDDSQKKKSYECTLGRFDAIEIGEPELKKINEFKAVVGEPKFIAGCY